jgi:biopolymer transport protein ExbD
MINAKHEALNRYALLTGFIVLLLVPLLVVLFAAERFPPERHETVNLPRYMDNAAHIAFNRYDEDPRILVSLPNDGETYLGRYRLMREDLIESIKKLRASRPADAGIVYLKAGVAVSHGSIVETLQTIRAAGIDRVGLVVKKGKTPDGGNENGSLEVKLQVEPAEERDYAKIDPLMLVVSVESDGTLRLNRMRIGAISDTKELASTLSDVFRERATIPGAVQEKTVFISGPTSARYDHVARLIDVVAGTGASPIIMQLDKDLPARLPPPKPAGDKLSLRP